MPVLLACNISTSVPGVYAIRFSVTSSAGLTARANRTLIVLRRCTAGEMLCVDKVSARRWDLCGRQLNGLAACSRHMCL